MAPQGLPLRIGQRPTQRLEVWVHCQIVAGEQRDPDGHRIELFTSDYLTVDPDLEPLRWSLTDPQRQTLWGHPAPKSWFEEGSEFPSVPVREPVLEARPVVAR